MSWVRLDDGFPEHPKIAGLSDRAFRLHVAALCYCARNLTNGFVSRMALRSIGRNVYLTRAQGTAKTLVAAGLWVLEHDGYRIHDYLDYNPSAEVVKRERAAARERMRRHRSGEVTGERSGRTFGRSSRTPSRPEERGNSLSEGRTVEEEAPPSPPGVAPATAPAHDPDPDDNGHAQQIAQQLHERHIDPDTLEPEPARTRGDRARPHADMPRTYNPTAAENYVRATGWMDPDLATELQTRYPGIPDNDLTSLVKLGRELSEAETSPS